jgi:hypothetical protein
MLNTEKNKPKLPERKCGDCTMCCQGWLYGEAYDHTFYAGKPCHYVGCNGCSIYEDRPEEPCKSYTCAWLDSNDFLPEWFKPDQSKIICTWRTWKDDEKYLDVTECGEQMNSRYLHWLIDKHSNEKMNLVYSIFGMRTSYGSSEFLQWINEN